MDYEVYRSSQMGDPGKPYVDAGDDGGTLDTLGLGRGTPVRALACPGCGPVRQYLAVDEA